MDGLKRKRGKERLGGTAGGSGWKKGGISWWPVQSQTVRGEWNREDEGKGGGR